MVACEGDVAGMTFQGRNQGLGGIVPDLDSLIVRGSQQIRLVGLWVVVNVVDALGLMSLQGIIRVP